MAQRTKRRQRHHVWPWVLGLAAVVLCLGLLLAGPGTGQEASPRETIQETGAPQTDASAPPVNIPGRLRQLAGENPETAVFVHAYPGDDSPDIDISGDYTPGQIPHFLQWDLRWGYHPYGGNRVEDLMGLSGCGPTALSMVVVGLTGNLEANPAAVADFAVESGYFTENDGTQWTLISQGAAHYGLTVWEIPLWEASMAQALEDGPIICVVGPGDFTDKGHFLVLTSYEDGAFHLLDPNSRANSEKAWTYGQLEGQIRAMWGLEAVP